MRTVKLTIIAGIITASLIAFGALTPKNNKSKSKTDVGKGFAVVELFTSEGCSSCPPADELAARIEKESAGKPIYILAYHVDYWNSLGWKDIFSKADFSKRQRQYAQYLNISSVYTPQVVVNGKKEFVGSEEGTLRTAIRTALQTDAPAQLVLTDVKTDAGHLSLRYQANATGDHTALLIALVQKQAQNHIKGGENGGRTLSHVQIVKNLQSIVLTGNNSGNESMALPANFAADGFEVIGFLQNTSTGQIIGATKAAIPAMMNDNISKNSK